MNSTGPRPPRRPTFVWQAALVVLPVVVLAALGLVSLRQDRALAEQQAKESAQILADQMAREAAPAVERTWSSYEWGLAELLAWHDSEVGRGLTNVGQAPDSAEYRPAFEIPHPFSVPASPLRARCRVDAAGRPLAPRDYPATPAPPDWLSALGADQFQLWQAAQAAMTGRPDAPAEDALRQFLASNPPDEAKANAEFLQLQLRDRSLPAEAVFTNLLAFARQRAGAVSASGLPLGQLAALQALRVQSPGREFSPQTCAQFAPLVLDTPSVLSPVILRELESRVRTNAPSGAVAPTAGTPAYMTALHELWKMDAHLVPNTSGTRAYMTALHELWKAEEHTRRTLAALRDQHDPAGWTNDVLAFDAPDNEAFLAAIEREPVPSGLDGSARPLPTFEVRLVPAQRVERALSNVVAASAVPRYAVVAVQFGGRSWLPGGGAQSHSTAAASLPLLAEATSRPAISANPDGALLRNLVVRISLADAPLLYARQRQRGWLFGALILAAAVTALTGLVAAQRAFARQLRLSEMKSNFVSSVSHELRAPIASVRLLAENLDRGKVTDEAKRRDYFRLIGQECRRLSALIENALDFSRIDQGRKRYEFEPTDLAELVRQTVEVMQPYAAERHVRLEFSIPQPSTITPQSDLDGRAIQQALVNLIDNAVKHSPAGETVTISLNSQTSSLNSQPSTLNLSVSDHGPGIPAAEHGRIFEPFYRRGSELRRETPGVGIGLTIVQHVVAAHGGRVRVESEVGKGSRFIIELPVRRDPNSNHG
jgi:signal transduction histidine kinase